VTVRSWDGGTRVVAPEPPHLDRYFGSETAISGNLAVVGAWADDALGKSAGAAFVFRRVGANAWDPGQKIIALDGKALGRFGWSVAISGDYVIVGPFPNVRSAEQPTSSDEPAITPGTSGQGFLHRP